MYNSILATFASIDDLQAFLKANKLRKYEISNPDLTLLLHDAHLYEPPVDFSSALDVAYNIPDSL